jgi:hypothetical protein
VRADVGSERRLLRRSVVAVRAHVRSLPRVRSEVLRQLSLLRCSEVAELACVRLEGTAVGVGGRSCRNDRWCECAWRVARKTCDVARRSGLVQGEDWHTGCMGLRHVMMLRERSARMGKRARQVVMGLCGECERTQRTVRSCTTHHHTRPFTHLLASVRPHVCRHVGLVVCPIPTELTRVLHHRGRGSVGS